MKRFTQIAFILNISIHGILLSWHHYIHCSVNSLHITVISFIAVSRVLVHYQSSHLYSFEQMCNALSYILCTKLHTMHYMLTTVSSQQAAVVPASALIIIMGLLSGYCFRYACRHCSCMRAHTTMSTVY
jgi:hypothetical protein